MDLHASTGSSRGSRSATARFAVGALLPTLIASGIVFAVSQSSAGATTPGTPGKAQAGTVLFKEDFQNGVNPVETLDNYTSTLNKGQTYSADTDWLSNCNGLIASAAESVTDAAGVSSCKIQSAWNDVQLEAEGLGMYTGQADPTTNYAVTAYTQANPTVGSMLQTNAPIKLKAAGRFLLLQADTAAENCSTPRRR
jgi:hypothetical protein